MNTRPCAACLHFPCPKPEAVQIAKQYSHTVFALHTGRRGTEVRNNTSKGSIAHMLSLQVLEHCMETCSKGSLQPLQGQLCGLSTPADEVLAVPRQALKRSLCPEEHLSAADRRCVLMFLMPKASLSPAAHQPQRYHSPPLSSRVPTPWAGSCRAVLLRLFLTWW